MKIASFGFPFWNHVIISIRDTHWTSVCLVGITSEGIVNYIVYGNDCFVLSPESLLNRRYLKRFHCKLARMCLRSILDIFYTYILYSFENIDLYIFNEVSYPFKIKINRIKMHCWKNITNKNGKRWWQNCMKTYMVFTITLYCTASL